MQQANASGGSVRERIEELEAAALSPLATLSRDSKGRVRPEPPDALRTAFQRDRDRVLHSKAFRRMKHKTQVFIAPIGDHFVTRLTHTLEVAQIARTIARSLRLNEDLVEAAALGHDVGHTPFGHTGEQALDALYPEGFRHNEQSLRTVDLLEKDGAGLNLTHETRESILRHSKPRGDFLYIADLEGLTLESQVVRVSDAIAYLAHDINDAIRAGVLTEEDLPTDAREVLGARHSQRVDTMVHDLIEASWACAGFDTASAQARPHLAMSPQVRSVVNDLREFMFDNVYLPRDDSVEGLEAKRVLELLYEEFLRRPDEVPEHIFLPGEPVERAVIDYIAGMTDQFALRTAERLRPGFVTELLNNRT